MLAQELPIKTRFDLMYTFVRCKYYIAVQHAAGGQAWIRLCDRILGNISTSRAWTLEIHDAVTELVLSLVMASVPLVKGYIFSMYTTRTYLAQPVSVGWIHMGAIWIQNWKSTVVKHLINPVFLPNEGLSNMKHCISGRVFWTARAHQIDRMKVMLRGSQMIAHTTNTPSPLLVLYGFVLYADAGLISG